MKRQMILVSESGGKGGGGFTTYCKHGDGVVVVMVLMVFMVVMVTPTYTISLTSNTSEEGSAGRTTTAQQQSDVLHPHDPLYHPSEPHRNDPNNPVYHPADPHKNDPHDHLSQPHKNDPHIPLHHPSDLHIHDPHNPFYHPSGLHINDPHNPLYHPSDAHNNEPSSDDSYKEVRYTRDDSSGHYTEDDLYPHENSYKQNNSYEEGKPYGKDSYAYGDGMPHDHYRPKSWMVRPSPIPPPSHKSHSLTLDPKPIASQDSSLPTTSINARNSGLHSPVHSPGLDTRANSRSLHSHADNPDLHFIAHGQGSESLASTPNTHPLASNPGLHSLPNPIKIDLNNITSLSAYEELQKSGTILVGGHGDMLPPLRTWTAGPPLDHGESSTRDPAIPENPEGLKDPSLLVGPWEEEPTVRITKAIFKGDNGSMVEAQVGTTAKIPCVIQNRADHETVSWIRLRDHHLITVGRQTYTNDERFSVTYNRYLNEWILHLRYAQHRDAGQYVCQLSTHPPMVFLSSLTITQASSSISGGPERYVQEGSSVVLNCTLRHHTQPPEYVFWYHNRTMINYVSDRQVVVQTTKDGSTLTLTSVGHTDSGNYTCLPPNSYPSSIILHIIAGDKPAAVQVSGTRGPLRPNQHLLLFLLLPFLLLPSPAVLPLLHSS